MWCPCCQADHPLPWYQQMIVWFGWMDYPWWNCEAQLLAMEGE